MSRLTGGTLMQHLLTPRGFSAMKLHRSYSSIACLCLCPTQSASLISNKTPLGTTTRIPIRHHHQHGSTSISSILSPFHHAHSLSESLGQKSSRHYSSPIDDLDGADLVAETSHLPRLYVDTPSTSSLLEKHLLSLTPFQSNYLSVMRVTNTKRWGQWAGHVRIFNGKDGEWLAKVIINESSSTTALSSPNKKRRRRQGGNDTSGDSTILECVQQTIPQPSVSSSMPEVHLHMGKLKKQRRKWVLEKTTELGITAIDIVDMEYSEQKEPWEQEKHRLQVIEAAEQCERLTVPTLVDTPTVWSDLMKRITESSASDNTDSNVDHHWLVCRERSINETVPILTALDQIHETSNHDRKNCIHILVGPEGGWSPTELEDLANAKSNGNNNDNNLIHFVSLGSLILRAETATISAVTATVLAMDQRRSS